MKRSPYTDLPPTVDEVYAVTARQWTGNGHIENLLTVLAGARSLSDFCHGPGDPLLTSNLYDQQHYQADVQWHAERRRG